MPEQVVYRGEGAIHELKGMLKRKTDGGIFIVGGSVAASGELERIWREAAVPCVLFRDFSPNPRYEEAMRAVRLFQETGCDMIVGMGGGSAIDVAKCVKLFCSTADGTPDPRQDSEGNSRHPEQKPHADDVRLIAIPTTAGTGSEATRFAVVYDNGNKQSICHDSILPDTVILDGSFLKGLPDYQKRATLLDALCQAVESMWSIHSIEMSRGLAGKAIFSILSNWNGYLAGEEWRNQRVLEAAYLSGKAIHLTQTTAAHAMSYKMTSLFGIAHGHAVALCLPHVWEYLYLHRDACTDPRGAGHLSRVLQELSESFGGRSAAEGSQRFLSLLEEMEMYERRPITSGQLTLLTESVNPVRLKNTPVFLSGEALEGMYRRVFVVDGTVK